MGNDFENGLDFKTELTGLLLALRVTESLISSSSYECDENLKYAIKRMSANSEKILKSKFFIELQSSNLDKK